MQTVHETKRLLLKVLPPEEAPMVLDFYKRNSEYLQPYEPERADNFYTENYQKANLLAEYNAFIKFTYLRFWFFEKENLELPIGTICYSNICRGYFDKCIVGYKTDKAFAGLGYATEALQYTLQLLFEEYGMHRIEALTLPDNQPSIRVLERLGFKKEGCLHDVAKINGKWQDHLLYALVPEIS